MREAMGAITSVPRVASSAAESRSMVGAGLVVPAHLGLYVDHAVALAGSTMASLATWQTEVGLFLPTSLAHLGLYVDHTVALAGSTMAGLATWQTEVGLFLPASLALLGHAYHLIRQLRRA